MAASVRVEDEAFSDRRYNRLARLAGLADADHARGKLLVLWRQCTIENREVLPVDDVVDVLGENGANALVESRLGEWADDGIRIKGTKGRIEWLEKLRENGRKGGRPKKKQKETREKTKRKPSGFENQNPPAPAPAPAPAPMNNSPCSPPPGDAPPGWSELRAAQRQKLAKHLATTQRLWEYQNELRTGRALKATAERLLRIADRLSAGATEEECRLVLEQYAAEAKRNPDSAHWFNGETNWRKDNFDRALGSAVPKRKRAGDFGDLP